MVAPPQGRKRREDHRDRRRGGLDLGLAGGNKPEGSDCRTLDGSAWRSQSLSAAVQREAGGVGSSEGGRGEKGGWGWVGEGIPLRCI